MLERDEAEDDHPANESQSGLDEERSFHRFLDDSDSRLPQLHGFAIVPRLDSLGMSCVPNCKVAIAKGSSNSVAFSLQCSSAGEPPTHCPFPTTLSRHKRKSMWKNRCEKSECICPRCLFEAGDAAAVAVALKDLRRIAGLAQDDHRFKHALCAFDAILAKEPNDGDALFGRARVTSWNDCWSEARRLMLAASKLAPDHAGIKSHLADEEAFVLAAGPSNETQTFTAESFTKILIGNKYVYQSVEGCAVLSPNECAQAIIDTEDYVASTGGWTTQRHVAVATTDVQVKAVPKLHSWFRRVLRDRLYPALGIQYGVCPSNMRVIDAFVVKYDARAQRYLPIHKDQSQYSLTLPLNSNEDYSGGGTYFVETDQVINCAAGGMVSFPGKLLHAGHPVSKGIRYIIVATLYEYKDNASSLAEAVPPVRKKRKIK